MSHYIYRFFIFWYICGVLLVTFDLLPPWLEWANSVFLITAGIVAALYFINLYGRVRGISYSFFIIVVSILIEQWGVEYGFLFGSYDYKDNFGIKIADTPVTIGFAWLLIIGCSHEISRGITPLLSWINKALFIIFGGLIAVTMDLILDPVAFKVKQYWIWKEPGFYYDIPFSNFSGWFLLAAFFHLVFVLSFSDARYTPTIWSNRIVLVFGLVVGMFCLIGLTHGLVQAPMLVLILTLSWYALYFWRRAHDSGK